jgi:predicted PurR-regulated permease PerM
MQPDLIASITSSLGVVGALVWYLYHNTTRTIPDLTDRYTSSIDKISQNFAETLKEERSYRKQEISSLQQWIKSEASCKYNQDMHNRVIEIKDNHQ